MWLQRIAIVFVTATLMAGSTVAFAQSVPLKNPSAR